MDKQKWFLRTKSEDMFDTASSVSGGSPMAGGSPIFGSSPSGSTSDLLRNLPTDETRSINIAEDVTTHIFSAWNQTRHADKSDNHHISPLKQGIPASSLSPALPPLTPASKIQSWQDDATGLTATLRPEPLTTAAEPAIAQHGFWPNDTSDAAHLPLSQSNISRRNIRSQDGVPPPAVPATGVERPQVWLSLQQPLIHHEDLEALEEALSEKQALLTRPQATSLKALQPASAAAAAWQQQQVPAAEGVWLLHTPRRQRRGWVARGQSALKVAWEHQRLTYEEIPSWMRDNSLIQGQYRPQMTFRQALGSLFSVHNETYNTWSHLVGLLLALAAVILFSLEPLPSASSPPKWPLMVCLVSAMYLYSTSAAAHLFQVIGKGVSTLLWKLDHTAIAVGCTGAFFPICQYAFACSSSTALVYIAVTCVLAGGVVTCSMLSFFHLPQYRSVRAAVQLSFALWGQIPLLHATQQLLQHPQALAALLLVYASIGVMVLGAVIFAYRVTDRLMPGQVDLIGSSHNIMHTLVVISNMLFLAGGRELWLWRGSADGAC